jgi:hypothetical protein
MRAARLKTALACLALALVAGCEPGGDQKGQNTTNAAVSANLTISKDEAAGISAPMPMTEAAVTAAAPGFYVAARRVRAGANILETFVLSTDAGDMFRLYPSADGQRLDAIAAISPQVRLPTDEHVSVSTYYQAPRAEVAYCEARTIDNSAAGFACSSDANGRLWRVYKLSANYDGPSAPFDAIDPDAATDATLVEMRWIAPGAH